MDPGSSSSEDQEADPSILHTAVKLGDVIRKHVRDQSTQAKDKGLVERFIDPSATTPGLMEGLAVAIVTAGLLTPVRSAMMRATAKTPLAVFSDLLASSSLVIGASMSGLYVGSLVGSTVYLKQLVKVSTHGESPTADAICGSELMRELLQKPSESSDPPSSYAMGDRDPRYQAIHAYQQALQKCRDRSEYQQEQRNMF